MQDYTYYKKALHDVAMPCAFIDADILSQNITQIAANNHNKNIRIASKSIQSVPVLNDIFKASPIFKGIMCFTADEAIYLNQCGFDDLLIAHPVE